MMCRRALQRYAVVGTCVEVCSYWSFLSPAVEALSFDFPEMGFNSVGFAWSVATHRCRVALSARAACCGRGGRGSFGSSGWKRTVLRMSSLGEENARGVRTMTLSSGVAGRADRGVPDTRLLLEGKIRDAMISVYGDEVKDIDPMLTSATREDFGDYQCNAAMGLAKVTKSKPRDVASKIVEVSASS